MAAPVAAILHLDVIVSSTTLGLSDHDRILHPSFLRTSLNLSTGLSWFTGDQKLTVARAAFLLRDMDTVLNTTLSKGQTIDRESQGYGVLGFTLLLVVTVH